MGMLTLAPLVLARDCFRADAVGPPATETAAMTWSLADCTTLDFSCTGNSSVPAAESGKLCENALQADEVASLTEALKSDAPNLVSLELRGNWVGPLKGAALATALQAHPSLEFLGLASTALGDVGGTALARRLLLQDAPPALRRIDLSHNHLGDDCARALAESLKAEDGLPLSSLDLSWNGIGPRGGRYLGDALKVNDALLELRLRWNGLQDRGARALGKGSALQPRTRTLTRTRASTRARARAPHSTAHPSPNPSTSTSTSTRPSPSPSPSPNPNSTAKQARV